MEQFYGQNKFNIENMNYNFLESMHIIDIIHLGDYLLDQDIDINIKFKFFIHIAKEYGVFIDEITFLLKKCLESVSNKDNEFVFNYLLIITEQVIYSYDFPSLKSFYFKYIVLEDEILEYYLEVKFDSIIEDFLDSLEEFEIDDLPTYDDLNNEIFVYQIDKAVEEYKNEGCEIITDDDLDYIVSLANIVSNNDVKKFLERIEPNIEFIKFKYEIEDLKNKFFSKYF
jgi:hypothetical protein